MTLMQTSPAIFQRLSKSLKRYQQDWGVILIIILVTILVTVPIYVHCIYFTKESDFFDHVEYAKLMLYGQYQNVPIHILAHPGYQLLLIGLYLITFHKMGMFASAVVVQVVVQVLTVLVIYIWLGPKGNKSVNWPRAFWAITLTIVAPVMVFVFWDHLFYLGYIGLANYHNPTIQLLKPLALVSFICAVRVFATSRASWRLVILSALLVILSALVKPNYLICILPALGMLAMIHLIWRRPIDWRLFILGFLIPGMLVLLVQLGVTYYLPGNDNSSILFSPLGVMGGYSKYLLPKLFLSILFPLAVLVFNFRQVSRDTTLILSWLGFLISLGMTYFLAEGGTRFSDGNFSWGSQIMLLLLFVSSARFLWREKFFPGLWRKQGNMLALIAYALHLCAGVAYYVYAITLIGRYPL